MAFTDYQVLTPERVNLQYDIAGIGSRGAAAFVDAVIQGIALAVLGMAVLAVSALDRGFGTSAGYITLALGVVLLALITLGYFIVFEIVWSGQTPGKRIVGVRVIRENGYPIRPADAVIRNVVRIVDGLPVLYAVGVLVMLLNARSKRLGDYAAGTLVVREGNRSLVAPDLQSREPAAPGTFQLQNSEATLVRDFLGRRATMQPQQRRDLAHRIATAIAVRYALPPPSDAEAFLESLSL